MKLLFLFCTIFTIGLAVVFVASYPDANQSISVIADSLYRSCAKGASLKEKIRTCYDQQFQSLSLRKGSSFAFQALLALQLIDPSTQACHEIAHAIGKGTFESSRPRQSPSYLCAYGEIHGIVEAALQSLGKGATLTDALAIACGKNPPYNCIHLLGKVILVETHGDTKTTLSYCRSTSSYGACASGVFGELSKPLHLIAHGIYTDAILTDPTLLTKTEELCRTQTGEEMFTCWEEMAHAVVRIFPNDETKVFAYCDRAQLVSARARCKTHAIGDFLRLASFDTKTIVPLCQQAHAAGTAHEEECEAESVKQLLFREPGKLRTELTSAVNFCTGLPTQAQLPCFTSIGTTVSLNANTDIEIARAVCQTAPESYRDTCLGKK